MFKFKKTQKWHIFKKDQEPICKYGDIIRIKESTGTFKVTRLEHNEGTWTVYIDIIIPKSFSGQSLPMAQDEEYRVIGKSIY